VRKFVALAVIQLGFLAACGGGGGYGGGTPPPPPPPPTQMIATPGPPNVETLTVDAGPANSVNTAFVSVKVCVPGSTTNCKTIDHIEIDTGSTGLRIISSVLSAAPALTLPAETDGTNPLAECLQFADGYTWGSLANADITLPVSMETASNVHVHIIGDPTYAKPSTCTGVGQLENTVALFGANGILGVGPFAQDCGSACVTAVTPLTVYYSCPSPSTCAAANEGLTLQVQNPVTLFTTDNNGVIVELPAVGTAGSTPVSGSLVFGIGTRTTNALGTATVLPADVNTGFITGTYKGTAYVDGYMDSGSNGNFFTDTLTQCTTATGFYCPASTMSESATLKGTSAATLAAPFSVANAETLFATASYTAFSNLGGTISDPKAFDLGLSFFYGHNVFTAIEGNTVSGNMGPFFAY
jgi:hypothetical protein